MDSNITYKTYFTEGKYWGKVAAGVLFLSKDTGRVLLMYRSGEVNEGHTWGIISGKTDGDEAIQDALLREIDEETRYNGTMELVKAYVFKDDGFEFHNFLGLINKEFIPELNWENDDYKWCDINELPEPLHFGVELLLQHSGPKIKTAIEHFKRKNAAMIAEIDAPPAIVQNKSIISQNFIEYLKSVENGIKRGYDKNKKLWFHHDSPEGGLPTIGYGHKIKNEAEKQKYSAGITDKEVEELLRKDILDAYGKVVDYHNKWVNDYIKNGFDIIKREPNHKYASFYRNLKPNDPVFRLNQKQVESLIDFVFNLGGLKSFPKFADSVFRGDWDTASKEGIRKYTDAKGERKELAGRNRAFKDYFDLNEDFLYEAKETAIEYPITVAYHGLKGVDTKEYSLESDFGFIDYEITGNQPTNRLVTFVNIGIHPEFRKKGFSKKLLYYFFKNVLKRNDTLDVEVYTNMGNAYVKPRMELLAKDFGIKLL